MTRNIKHLGQLAIGILARFVDLTNLVSLPVSQFGPGVVLALRRCGQYMAAFLAEHVMSIVLWRSEKKVVRVDASPVIAFVANEKSFWNWTSKKFPRNPMSLFVSWVVSSFFVGCKLTVLSTSKSAVPVPAGLGFVDLLKEAFLDTFAFHSHGGDSPKMTMPAMEVS